MPESAVAAALALLAVSLAAIVLVRGAARRNAARVVVLGSSAAAACALIAAAATHRTPESPPSPDHLPLQAAAPGDVTSRACRSCHPDQHASWHASYHRTMTQTVSPRSVLGDFRDARVEFGGVRYRMFTRDDRYFAEVDGRGEAPPVELPLEQTTGSHHLQIYWTARGPGRRLQAFPLVWLRSEQRWIPRLAAFVTPPSNEEARPSIWNDTCIGCHTTHPRPRLDLKPPWRADSHVTEFGIACEACHGDGAEHARAHRSPLHRYRAHFTSGPDPQITNPNRLSHVRSAQVCGQCHAVRTFHTEADARRWAVHGPSFRPGDDLDEKMNVITTATLDRPYVQQIMKAFPDFVSGSFWDDGIVRVVGREYSALIESGCFQRGELACTSCHEMHQAPGDPRDRKQWANDQLRLAMDTDRACTQCHESLADPARASEHSHHVAGSTGDSCLNCHMPHTAYGLLKAVRAHEIHSPRVRTSGPGSSRPNACNLCHLDRPLAWSAEHLSRWYGQPLPPLSDDDRRIAAGVRWAVAGDAGVRALLAWSMGWQPAQEAAGTAWLVPYLVDLMDDPYDAVRMIAAQSLTTIPEFAREGFDPLASPEQRSAAAHALRERWMQHPIAHSTPGEATLFDAQGRPLAAELARLRAQRDDRPLSLAE